MAEKKIKTRIREPWEIQFNRLEEYKAKHGLVMCLHIVTEKIVTIKEA